MRKTGITFAELRDTLIGLGFREAPDETTITRFVHPVTGTILLFRPRRPDDTVTNRELVVVRRQLVDNGLIEASALDRLLQ